MQKLFDLFIFICYNTYIGVYMSFLYLYDLVDFDENGNIKATKRYKDVKIVASNFLYLICKYNQNLLQEEAKKKGEKLELPPFFKERLSTLLGKVESGEMSKEHALVLISKECIPVVRKICDNAINDAEIIENLNGLISFNGLSFSKRVKDVTNKKQQEYIMTKISGELMDEITNLLAGEVSNEESPAKVKSNLYKKVISYNGLVNATMNLNNVKGNGTMKSAS